MSGHLSTQPDGASRDAFVGRLLDRANFPFFIADAGDRLLHVSGSFAAMLGRSPEECVGRPEGELLEPGHREQTGSLAQRTAQTGEPVRLDRTYRHAAGHLLDVEIVAEACPLGDDQPAGYLALVSVAAERKRWLRNLEESVERFRQLYDESPFGYHEIAPDGTILMVNQTECELLGYSREEMLGRPIFDFICEAQRETARKAVRDRVQGKRGVMSIERKYLRKDGQILDVAIENRVTRDENGQVRSIRSTVQDITWRKQAEAALIASERRARALFEGIEDAVFVHDLDGRILDANPAACRRLGYDRDELLRLNTREIDEQSFSEGFEERLNQQLRDGHLRIEGRHRTKAGRVIPVDINSSTIQLEDQTVVLAVIRDITERKALEETRRQFAESQLRNAQEIEQKNRALRLSEARYRQLTEGCLDAIVVASQDGLITLFNSAAERTFGRRSSEVEGKPMSCLFLDDQQDEITGAIQEYLITRSSRLVGQTVELKGRRGSGEVFPLEMSLCAIEVGGQIQFMGAIRDQGERQRMRAMLMQSEKLASIGLLSAGVAHEINNPLAYIANNLAVLERDLKGVVELVEVYESAQPALQTVAPEIVARAQAVSDDVDWPYIRANLARMIGRTREGVQRVANIVQNLRGLARTSPPKLEPALLSDLVSGAVDMTQSRARRSQIEVHTSYETTTKILCVPSQIAQVILNLLVNAIQAVETMHRDEGNRVEVRVREQGDNQIVEIEDTGCGIAPSEVARLFDPFYTTKPVGEGTGLGLSISHGIISGHGGQIEVESEPNVGSTFRITLPRRPVE